MKTQPATPRPWHRWKAETLSFLHVLLDLGVKLVSSSFSHPRPRRLLTHSFINSVITLVFWVCIYYALFFNIILLVADVLRRICFLAGIN
jgi:hypothetical protein